MKKIIYVCKKKNLPVLISFQLFTLTHTTLSTTPSKLDWSVVLLSGEKHFFFFKFSFYASSFNSSTPSSLLSLFLFLIFFPTQTDTRLNLKPIWNQIDSLPHLFPSFYLLTGSKSFINTSATRTSILKRISPREGTAPGWCRQDFPVVCACVCVCLLWQIS